MIGMKFWSGVSAVSAVSLALSLAAIGAPTSGAADAGKKVINFAIQFEPPNLNPMKTTDTVSIMVLGHIMEGLTRYDQQNRIVPAIAEKWKVSDKEATFHLRKDAKWSDGKPVRAQDFVFAWRKTLDPKIASEYAFILYPLKNAEAINQGKMAGSELGVVAKDDYTLQITFEKPCGYFVGLTSFATYLPAREDIYNKLGERYNAEAKDMVTNGPFVLTKWVHGASMLMEKNSQYWNKSAIQIDAIDVPYITADNSAQFNFFKDRKIDLLERLNKDDIQKAQSQGFRMQSFSDGSLWYLEFNHREGRATKNLNLRKAVAAMFNPEEFVSRVIAIPGTKPGRGLIPAWLTGVKSQFRKEYPIAGRKPNLAEAKKYLEAAKKELGTIPPLVILCDDKPQAAKEAEYFQQLFRTVLGIDVKIDKQIFKQRLAKMLAGEFDITLAGWGPDYADPMTFADLKATWNENNRGKYSNPEYDRLIREAQSTTDAKKRMDAMAAAEKILLDDVGILPTYERNVVYVNSDRIKGVVRRGVGFDPDFTFAQVVKQ